jgi:hypothetical protein
VAVAGRLAREEREERPVAVVELRVALAGNKSEVARARPETQARRALVARLRQGPR